MTTEGFLAPNPAALPMRMPLPVAVWYGVELAALMLGRDDAVLRAAARGVASRAALLGWAERCARTIARECGRERAERFRDQLQAALRAREPLPASAHD